MRTTAITGRGVIGTDLVRLTVVITDDGTFIRRADGTNSIIPVLPEKWRTDGDVTSQAAKLGHRVNVAAIPMVGLMNTAAHRQNKAMIGGFYTLEAFCEHMDSKNGAAIAAALRVSYAEDEISAAA